MNRYRVTSLTVPEAIRVWGGDSGAVAFKHFVAEGTSMPKYNAMKLKHQASKTVLLVDAHEASEPVNQRAGAGTRKGAAMPKPDKTGRENAAERSGGKSEGGGRENAPGQNKLRLFEHEDTGEEVTATMKDFHATLKGQGYRPVDEAEESDTPAVDEPTAPGA